MNFKNSIMLIATTAIMISGCAINTSEETVESTEATIETEERLILNENVEEEPNFSGQIVETDNTETIQDITVTPTIINDGTIVNYENILAVVNKNYTLPGNYEPSDLVIPDIPFYFDEDIPKRYLREEAAIAIEKLFSKAKEDGIPLIAASGYRSYNRQSEIFNAKASQVGEEQANLVVAIPGESEHQTGLALDVTTAQQNYQLEEEFGSTPEGLWLKDHAHLFGFIIRYPQGKEEITGYKYEPWHLRYVGETAAQQIYEKDITLEEFIELHNAVQVNSNMSNQGNG